jgi:hypothetical protein
MRCLHCGAMAYHTFHLLLCPLIDAVSLTGNAGTTLIPLFRVAPKKLCDSGKN